MEQSKSLLSKSTKIGLLCSFCCAIFGLMTYLSRWAALNHFQGEMSPLPKFGEQVDGKISITMLHVIVGDAVYYALFGIILIGIIFIITQYIDITKKQFSRKSLRVSLLWFILVSGYFIVILYYNAEFYL